MSTPRVLMVTREVGNDRRYGLGKSLAPVVGALCAMGIQTHYLCQDDLPAHWKDARMRWLQRLAGWPGLRGRAHRQLQLSAWLERLWMGFWAARVARTEGFTHVHLHDPWMGQGFRLARQWMGLKNVRWGITEHGFGSYAQATHADGLIQGPRAARWFRRLEVSALAAADWVICPTQLAAHALMQDLALPSQPPHWRVIAHPRPQAIAIDQQTAREQLGWDKQVLYVLAVGRVVPLKNMDWVLEICAHWAAQSLPVHLCVLGEGNHGALRQQAETLGFSEQLTIEVTDNVMPFFCAADVYVSASSTESFGLANLEAMCAGLPCVCTAVGGVPEVMGNGAWLVPCDKQAVSHALGTVLKSAHCRASWRQKAMVQASACPDTTSIALRYAELYSST